MNKKEYLKFIILSVIGAIIFMLVYQIWMHPQSVKAFFQNIKSLTSNSNSAKSNIAEDPLIKSCRASFNECREIVNQKYPSASYTLLKIEKFTDEEKAKEFYDTWRTQALSVDFFTLFLMTNNYTFGKFQDISPIVFIALRVEGEGGEVTNVVLCDNTGKLTKFSKTQLLC